MRDMKSTSHGSYNTPCGRLKGAIAAIAPPMERVTSRILGNMATSGSQQAVVSQQAVRTRSCHLPAYAYALPLGAISVSFAVLAALVPI